MIHTCMEKKCVVSQPDTQFTRTTNSTFNNFTLELNDALMTPRFPRLSQSSL